MANLRQVKKVDPVAFELGGKQRIIQFDMNAFGVLEDRFGSVDAAMKTLDGGKMGNLKVILWAGLIHEEVNERDEDGEPISYHITPYNVGSWILPYMMQDISEKLVQAINKGMPDAVSAPKQVESTPVVSDGPKMATVVLTPEEKAALEVEEEKNG